MILELRLCASAKLRYGQRERGNQPVRERTRPQDTESTESSRRMTRITASGSTSGGWRVCCSRRRDPARVMAHMTRGPYPLVLHRNCRCGPSMPGHFQFADDPYADCRRPPEPRRFARIRLTERRFRTSGSLPPVTKTFNSKFFNPARGCRKTQHRRD